MSLLLLEGFDTGDWVQRATTATSVAVDTTTKRTGYGSLAYSVSSSLMQWDVLAADRHATFVLGFGIYFTTTSVSNIVELYGEGVVHGRLQRSPDGSVRVLRNTVDLGSSATTPLTLNVWHYVEFSYTMGDGTAGSFAVHVDGVDVLSVSGVDTRNGGTTGLLDSVRIILTNNAGDFFLDDVYLCNGAGTVNNTLLGPIAVEALYPSGNGNYSQLVGSDGNSTDNYLLVDENPDPSGTDYVGSPTDGNKDTYLFADLSVPTAVIPGVEVRMWAAKSDVNPKSLRRVHRRGGVDSTGADIALADTYTSYPEVLELDPNGSVPWTVANLNASEWGVEVRP